MSKAYQWPQCTVEDCGHARTHKTEAKAKKMAAAKGKELTTKGGHAVCVCHAHWTQEPTGLEAVEEKPRGFFDCDQALGHASPAIALEPGAEAATVAPPLAERAETPEPEIAFDETRPKGGPPWPEPVNASQPLDPRDNPPW